MERHENLKLLAFVGLPGAGVTTTAAYLKDKNYPTVSFGSVVSKEMLAEGIDDSPANERIFREKLIAEKGSDYLALAVMPEINHLADAGQHRIVLDGMYTWGEYKTLKHEFPGELTTVAIVTPRYLRHRRLTSRPEKPLTDEQANEWDWSEIEKLEKGGPIAIADHYLTNAGSRELLQAQIDDLLVRLEY